MGVGVGFGSGLELGGSVVDSVASGKGAGGDTYVKEVKTSAVHVYEQVI